MAIAFVAQRAAATSAAAGVTWNGLTMAAGASIAPGNTLILSLAYRDAATPPTDQIPQPGNSLCVDLRGNLWRRVAVSANQGSSTAADTGAVSAIWVCHVTYPYVNGDFIAITAPITGQPMTHISGQIAEFSGVARFGVGLYNSNNLGNGTASIVDALFSAAGQIVYCSVAVASNPVLTGDSDTLNGSWSAIDQATSGGGGIRRGDQYKIVTGTAAQFWDVTWAGNQQWAATSLVLQEAQIPWPSNNAHLANPNFPCPAGPEIIPVDTIEVPVDTGTGYVFQSTPPPETASSAETYWVSYFAPLDRTVDSQHTLMAEVYPLGYEEVYNEPVTVNLGVPYAATLRGGATTTSGTAVAALAAVGGAQVILEVSQDVDCQWDTTALLPYANTHRILDVRVNYVAWKDDSAAPQPGEGLAVWWKDTLAVSSVSTSRASALYGAWLVTDYASGAKRVYRSLGEVNGVPQIGTTSRLQYGNVRAGFAISDFLRMASGTAQTLITFEGLNGSAPSQETVFLDTVELELVLVPETRLAHSARRVSSGVGFPEGDQTTLGALSLPMYDAYSSLNFWQAPANGNELSVVLREGTPPSPSDWFGAQTDPIAAVTNLGQNIRYTSMEAVGPSMSLSSVVQPRPTIVPVPDVSRLAWSDGQAVPNAEPTPYNDVLFGFTMLTGGSYQSWWPYYTVPNVLNQGVSVSSTITQQVATDGVQTYDYVKVVVQAPNSDTAPNLSISIEQPLATVLATATVTKAQVLALPDLGDGYREVHVPLSASITPSGATAVNIVMTSTTVANDPWVLAGAQDLAGTFGYFPFPKTKPTGASDYAVVLCCTLSALDVDVDSAAIEAENNGDAPCAVYPSTIPCVTVNNASDYSWLTIERIVGGTDATPVALLDVNAELTYPSVEVYDTFSRTVGGGWGTPDVGTAWVATLLGANTASVSSGRGVVTMNTTAGSTNASMAHTSVPLTLQTVRVALPGVPTGNTQLFALYSNDTVNDEYSVQATFATDGTVAVRFRRIVGGASTIRDTFTFPDVPAGAYLWMKLEVNATYCRYKTWLDATPEPDWIFSEARPAQTPFIESGVAFQRAVGNTSPDVNMYVDNYSMYDLADQPLTWCDYGVPWDLPANSIEYRVQGFRDSDHRTTAYSTTAWNGTSSNAGAAFGIATDDALYVYAPGSDSGQLELTWNRIYPVEMLPLAGKDYQVALRPSEVRGYSITTNVMVDKVGKCVTSDESASDDGTYDGLGIYDDDNFYDYPATSPTSEAPGAKFMAPTPFQQLNLLERSDAVALKLPGGHTRRVYLDCGAQVLIPVVGVAMAEITLTDVPPVDISVPEYPETL